MVGFGRGSMKWFVVSRVLQAIPLMVGIIIFTFVLNHLTPGDPVIAYVGATTYVSNAQLEQIRQQLGLDKPLYVQLAIYLSNVFQGNLGYSYLYRTPVLSLVLGRLQFTLILVVLPIIVSSILGVFLGVVAGRRQYSAVDNFASTLAVAGYSLPVFWLAQIFLAVFSLRLGWLPVEGMVTLGANLQGPALYLDMLKHMVLPMIALSAAPLALVTRLTRSGTIEALHQDYIIWARAKGVPERTVAFRHALRNALLPVVTLVGYSFGFVLSGAVLVESVFAWPGLGTLLVNSIFSKDIPTITGQLIIITITVVFANLITDLAYGFLDPRIRYR